MNALFLLTAPGFQNHPASVKSARDAWDWWRGKGRFQDNKLQTNEKTKQIWRSHFATSDQ